MWKALWKSLARTFLPLWIKEELFPKNRAALIRRLQQVGLSSQQAQQAALEAENWLVEHAAKV
jgi:hypothetical protein